MRYYDFMGLDFVAQSLNSFQKPTNPLHTPSTTIYNESFMPLIHQTISHFFNTMETCCQLKDQNISILIHGMKANSNLIKLTQLFISISVFSFIFSPSSLFVFLHYFKFYFSTLPFQLYTHNIDKNSMFLLCNGLLVFVGLTKSFSGSSCDADDDKTSNNTEVLSSSQYLEEEEEDCSQSHIFDVEVNEPMLEREAEKRTSEPDEQSAEEEEERVEEENIEKITLIGEEKEEDVELFDEDDEEQDVELFDEDDEEEEDVELLEEVEEDYVEEEEESSILSTEELNKKFEDFIRKMKEDLRIDARRHLVMV